MFNFRDETTSEYANFRRYVDPASNKPYGINHLKNNLSVLEYNYVPKFDSSLFMAVEKDNFLASHECAMLIDLVEKRNAWLCGQNTIPFWDERNTPLFNLFMPLSDDTELASLLLRIHDGLREFLSKEFNDGGDIYCDQIGIVRWPVGSWQMTHIDHVEGYQRVCGSVIYLNDDYEGGETFYPFFEKSMKPKTGKVFAHSPDNEHLHGVTTIGKATRYTISSTWGTNPKLRPYAEKIAMLRNKINF